MKPREFWIDVSDEHDGDIPIAFREHPGQGPLQWQANLIHVIEYSAYKKLQARHKKLLEALRTINPDDTYENYNEQIALEAIEADRKASESNK